MMARLGAVLGTVAAWTIAAVIAAAVANAWLGIPGMMLLAVSAGAGWWYSLRVKEWQNCPSCGGRGGHTGIMARRSKSLCGRCQGSSGRVVRWGVRFLRPARCRELMAGAGRGDQPVWKG